jgi:hypothetical protein
VCVRLSESLSFVVKEGVEQPDGDNSVRLFFFVLYRDGLHLTVTYMKCWGCGVRFCLPLKKLVRGRIST